MSASAVPPPDPMEALFREVFRGLARAQRPPQPQTLEENPGLGMGNVALLGTEAVGGAVDPMRRLFESQQEPLMEDSPYYASTDPYTGKLAKGPLGGVTVEEAKAERKAQVPEEREFRTAKDIRGAVFGEKAPAIESIIEQQRQESFVTDMAVIGGNAAGELGFFFAVPGQAVHAGGKAAVTLGTRMLSKYIPATTPHGVVIQPQFWRKMFDLGAYATGGAAAMTAYGQLENPDLQRLLPDGLAGLFMMLGGGLAGRGATYIANLRKNPGAWDKFAASIAAAPAAGISMQGAAVIMSPEARDITLTALAGPEDDSPEAYAKWEAAMDHLSKRLLANTVLMAGAIGLTVPQYHRLNPRVPSQWRIQGPPKELPTPERGRPEIPPPQDVRPGFRKAGYVYDKSGKPVMQTSTMVAGGKATKKRVHKWDWGSPPAARWWDKETRLPPEEAAIQKEARAEVKTPPAPEKVIRAGMVATPKAGVPMVIPQPDMDPILSQVMRFDRMGWRPKGTKDGWIEFSAPGLKGGFKIMPGPEPRVVISPAFGKTLGGKGAVAEGRSAVEILDIIGDWTAKEGVVSRIYLPPEMPETRLGGIRSHEGNSYKVFDGKLRMQPEGQPNAPWRVVEKLPAAMAPGPMDPSIAPVLGGYAQLVPQIAPVASPSALDAFVRSLDYLGRANLDVDPVAMEFAGLLSAPEFQQAIVGAPTPEALDTALRRAADVAAGNVNADWALEQLRPQPQEQIREEVQRKEAVPERGEPTEPAPEGRDEAGGEQRPEPAGERVVPQREDQPAAEPAREVSAKGRSDAHFHSKVLRNRDKPEQLRKWGIESTAEADRLVALMRSGSGREDALYALRQAREKPAKPHKKQDLRKLNAAVYRAKKAVPDDIAPTPEQTKAIEVAERAVAEEKAARARPPTEGPEAGAAYTPSAQEISETATLALRNIKTATVFAGKGVFQPLHKLSDLWAKPIVEVVREQAGAVGREAGKVFDEIIDSSKAESGAAEPITTPYYRMTAGRPGLLPTKAGKERAEYKRALATLHSKVYPVADQPYGVSRMTILQEPKIAKKFGLNVPPPTPYEQKILDGFEKIKAHYGERFDAEGTLIEVRPGYWVPFTEVGRERALRLFTPWFFDLIRYSGEGVSEPKRILMDAITKWNGMSDEVTLTMLRDMEKRGAIHRTATEQGRVFEFFPDFIENGGLTVWLTEARPFDRAFALSNRSAKRLGYVRHLGQDITGEVHIPAQSIKVGDRIKVSMRGGEPKFRDVVSVSRSGDTVTIEVKVGEGTTTVSSPATKMKQVFRPEDQARTADLVRRFTEAGGREKDINDVIRVSNGIPIEQPIAPPGTPWGWAAEAGRLVLSARHGMILGMAEIPNLPETWFKSAAFLGFRRMAKVWGTTLTRATTKEGRALNKGNADYFARIGAITREVAQWNVNRGKAMRDMGRMLFDVLYFKGRWGNEFNDFIAVMQAGHAVKDWIRGDLSGHQKRLDRYVLENMMGFSAKDAAQMVSTGGTKAQRERLLRSFGTLTQHGSTLHPAEMPRSQHSRLFTYNIHYQGYARGTWDRTFRLVYGKAKIPQRIELVKKTRKAAQENPGDQAAQAAHRKAWDDFLSAVEIWVKYHGGAMGAGFAAKTLRAMSQWKTYGLLLVANELYNHTFQTMLESLYYTLMGGMADAGASIVSGNTRTGDHWFNPILEQSGTLTIGQEALEMVAGTGPYRDLDWGDRFIRAIERQATMSQPTRVIASSMGLYQDDPVRRASINKVYNWLRENDMLGRYLGSGKDDRFRIHMKKASAELARGFPTHSEQVQKHLRAAVGERDIKAVRASLLGRRVLFDKDGNLLPGIEMTQEQADDLYTVLPEKGWEKVRAHDRMLSILAK